MASVQISKPINITLISIARLNIRKDQPNTSAIIAEKIETGALLKATGIVKGESVFGNSDWYAGDGNTFFWSGAVKEYTSSDPLVIPTTHGTDSQISLESDFEQFLDRLGLKHFKGSEFTPYWSRVKNGISNSVPPMPLWNNIIKTIVILDALRPEFEAPITILSSYRSPRYNAAVGGEPASFHMKFMAIDFTCAQGNPLTWATLLRECRGKSFDLPGNAGNFIFRGGIGIYKRNNFVHLDTRGNDANWES